MKIEFILLTVAAAVLFAGAAGILYLRRYISKMDYGSVAGFNYDPVQHIFYSAMDAWQRNFGYCRPYDEAMLLTGMAVDSEPVRFSYGGRQWLIELWKGQYGMCMGAEVGVYSTYRNREGFFTVYSDTSEFFQISMTLYKNGIPVFVRDGRHWWMTGFVLGGFARPDELALLAKITLADAGMRDAFVSGLIDAGYSRHELLIDDNTVGIAFTSPRTAQPATRLAFIERIVLWGCKRMCGLFNELTKGVDGLPDKIEYLRKADRRLYKKFVRSAVTGRYRPGMRRGERGMGVG